MKYKDLIQFESLDEVVKFNRLDDVDYRKSMVSSYVFSDTYEKTIIPEICRNLDYTAGYETFGLQIVGTYGTGKSHLMSLFSLIAENADYLSLVQSESARKVLANIAGKYKIIRFEMGSDDELWNLVVHQIDMKFQEWGINYSIAADQTKDMYNDKLNRMMAQFEAAFPDKGLMIVIDEMLSYLRGRATGDKLNRDLAVIQALGQRSDHSKFRMVFGVQELIYTDPNFQFAAKMLNQVSQRYRQIEITKQDVQFVTEQRILRKTDEQKAVIRQHLSKFTEFFTDMHAKLDEYVNLFPVNPTFFENFQQIKIGKSQREILKTLSRKFADIAEGDIPTDQPGLIGYDSYWADLQSAQMQTYPDIRRVTEIMQTVHQKIDENFTGVRAKKIPLAHRIANACAVRILQDSLEKKNGASAETLVDDLCYVDSSCLDREFLIDAVGTTARQIVSATVGQYFEQNNTNQEFHLRVEGGVNYEQKIKDFALTMSDDVKDSHFFNYLVEYLPIDVEQYRREFKIFRHHIDWKSHKVMLDGYIFMGNPSERSTTQPEQSFYIYFMPIFNKANMKHGDEPDSVYIHLDKVSDEMKQLIELYAAAEALIASVDSSQKPFYAEFKKRYETALRPVFDQDFLNNTEVWYMGEKQNITPAMMKGGSKEEVVSNIASTLLEDYFCQTYMNYPKFTLLGNPLTESNKATILKGARMKIANPMQSNRDGEAILAGLGLLQNNQLSTEGSIYALSVKQRLEDKGEGQVLNRDEIIHRFYKDWTDDWRSNDYDLPADLQFLVLATMVALGEIEISIPGGKTLTPVNLREMVDLPKEAFYSFTHVSRPRGMNTAVVRELFLQLTGKDMSAQLQNQEIYAELVSKAQALAKTAVGCENALSVGLSINNIELISRDDANLMRNQLETLHRLCDKIQNYASPAKMRNLPQEWTVDAVKRLFAAQVHITTVRKAEKVIEEFRPLLNYLDQAVRYMFDGSDLKNRAEDALKRFSENDNFDMASSKMQAFKAEFNKIVSDYADWYMGEYLRMHLTTFQETERVTLVNSEFNRVCQAVFRADNEKGYLSVAARYKEWSMQMSQLTVADTNVSRERLLQSPYAGGFDPSRFQGKQLPDFATLKDELQNIYINVDDTLKQILTDEDLKKNYDQLDSNQQMLFDRFTNGNETLAVSNAERLMEIVYKLHTDIRRITVTADGLIQHVLNRPMTPNEAIKAFRQFINEQVGGDDSNVRITFKK